MNYSSPPLCHGCNKNVAITFRKMDGRYLCKNCYLSWVKDVVRRTIRKKQLLKRNDRIVVGLSGGKDSSVLLDILYHIERDYPSELIAVCIDEGIAGYRDDGLPIAKMNAERLDVEFHLFSFKELFGYTLDEIVKRSRELQEKINVGRKNRVIQQGPCSFCGVFRRKALNLAARQLEADKVATGHNLNDVDQTVLLNLLRGDYYKILRGDLKPEKAHDLFVPRVKPLQAVAERDVVLYAYYNDLTFHTTECPYAVEAMRLDVRNFLIDIEARYPGTLNCIKNGVEGLITSCELKPQIAKRINSLSTLKLCSQCSEPASKEKCMACHMLDVLFNTDFPSQ